MSLLGGPLWAEVDRSRIITSFCCSIRPMFSVTCGLNCFFVYSCWSSLSVLLLFFTTDIHAFIYFTFFFKGIFHLGVLISRTHTSIYMSFTEWECVCFSSFVEYNFEIMNI